MKQIILSHAVRSLFIASSEFRLALVLAGCFTGLLFCSGCDSTTAKKEKQYKALKIRDTGNCVRNYWLAFAAYNDVLYRKTASQTPQERTRDQAIRDSIRRLPRTPERRNQLAQLNGFASAQQEDTLQRKAHDAYLAARKANPAFFRKSWQERRKWLLLAQADRAGAALPSSGY